jgi:hypothetical protein
MESLDSGHTTVKTENSHPGLSQGQDRSSRVLLRSARVATPAMARAASEAASPGRAVQGAVHIAVESGADSGGRLGSARPPTKLRRRSVLRRLL